MSFVTASARNFYPIREVVSHDHHVELRKEIHEVRTQDDAPLLCTRKHAVGDGKHHTPLLLVHGLGQNRFTWDLPRRSLMNWFVHHGFDVWNLELRGHGLSRANGAPYPEAFEDYTEKDVPATIQYILRETRRDQLAYCGHSLGGCIAYALAPELKSHLEALVTICSPFDFRHAIDRMKLLGHGVSWLTRTTPIEKIIPRYFAMDAIGRLIRSNLWYFDSHANRLPCQIWVPGNVERDVLHDLLKFSFDRTSNEVIRFMLEWLTSGAFENKVRGIDYRQRMDSIDCPTLIVAASKDELAPPDSVAAAFEHVGSVRKRLHILAPENTGFHWGHYDVLCGRTAPRQVWPVITDWLEETLDHGAEHALVAVGSPDSP